MKVYLIELKESKSWLSANSLQSTKDKWLGIMTKERADRYMEMIDPDTPVLHELDITPIRSCIVGDLSFGVGDTYSLTEKQAVVIHETSKFIYTCQVDDENELILRSVEKHKKSDLGKRDFYTGKGIKY